MNVEIMLFGAEEQVLCSSLDIAEEFKKKHYHVLRDIQNLDCSEKFRQSNYGFTSYTDEQGKQRPMAVMNYDGFMFLVMGYKGEKAAEIREAYIDRFNAMAKALREKQVSEQVERKTARIECKQSHRTLTDSIKRAKHKDRWIYKHLTDLELKIVSGMNAVQIRKANGAKKNAVATDFLTTEQLKRVKELDEQFAVLVDMGLSYREIKAIATRKQLLQ